MEKLFLYVLAAFVPIFPLLPQIMDRCVLLVVLFLTLSFTVLPQFDSRRWINMFYSVSVVLIFYMLFFPRFPGKPVPRGLYTVVMGGPPLHSLGDMPYLSYTRVEMNALTYDMNCNLQQNAKEVKLLKQTITAIRDYAEFGEWLVLLERNSNFVMAEAEEMILRVIDEHATADVILLDTAYLFRHKVSAYVVNLARADKILMLLDATKCFQGGVRKINVDRIIRGLCGTLDCRHKPVALNNLF